MSDACSAGQPGNSSPYIVAIACVGEAVERRLQDHDLQVVAALGGEVCGLVDEVLVLHVPRVHEQLAKAHADEALEHLAHERGEGSPRERQRAGKRRAAAGKRPGAVAEREQRAHDDVEPFGAREAELSREERIRVERQVVAVLLDRSDRDGHGRASFDRLRDLFPGVVLVDATAVHASAGSVTHSFSSPVQRLMPIPCDAQRKCTSAK